jgi:transcriptional regulator with XRE-family HTH domain
MPLSFGQALREAMTMSAADLARDTGIAESSISRMLADAQIPTLSVVQKLERALPKLKTLRDRIEA